MNLLNIEFNAKEAKYISLYKHIKHLIITMHLKPNEKIPSRRILSEELSLSSNTILNAYNLLLDEGYIYSKNKSGYYVSPFLNYQYRSTEITKEEKDNKFKFDLTSTNIDETIFPFYTLKKLTQDLLSNNPNIWLYKASFQGDINLRKVLANYLFENKGMNVNASNIIIVSSLEESLEIINSLLSLKSVTIENPTYLKVYHYFASQNIKINLCPIDSEGIVINEQKSDLVYVTPYNQFPLGIKMSNQRRNELINSNNLYILEDDFDCDLISRNKFMSTIYSLNNDKVIYHGSFSHTLCPGIRISYLVLPTSLISIYKEKYALSSSRISSLDQALLASFIKEGYYNRHIGRLKKSLKRKEEKIKNFLTIHQVSYIETELSFIIKTFQDENIIKKHLLDASINIHFVKDYAININDNRLILSYISIPEKDIDEMLITLLSIIK